MPYKAGVLLLMVGGLTACSPQPAYRMQKPSTGETVECVIRERGVNPVTQQNELRHNYLCIALCLDAGFRGDNPQLERSVGWERVIPVDETGKIIGDVPRACRPSGK
jgi:hypothetical protein